MAAVSGSTDSAYDVTASAGNLASLDATVTLSIVATGHGIADSNSNALTDTASTGANEVTYVVDNTAPTLSRGPEVGHTGTAIVFQFNENLQRSGLPVAGAFSVTADGNAVTVDSVDPVSGFVQAFSITLATAIRPTQTVVVVYTDPTSGDDANAIQDLAGNEVGTFTTGQNSILAVVNNSTANTSPTVATAIPDRGATVSTAFSYAFPDTTFSDAEGDTLTYEAMQADNSALPTWLSFASATRLFSGMPAAADVATLSVKVTASDSYGGTVSDTFDIIVSATANTAPTLVTAIPDQRMRRSSAAFSYAFPDTTFSDAESDALTYMATQADNSALPTWLIFASGTRAFSGMPTAADVGTLSVKVTASDGKGGSVSDHFRHRDQLACAGHHPAHAGQRRGLCEWFEVTESCVFREPSVGQAANMPLPAAFILTVRRQCRWVGRYPLGLHSIAKADTNYIGLHSRTRVRQGRGSRRNLQRPHRSTTTPGPSRTSPATTSRPSPPASGSRPRRRQQLHRRPTTPRRANADD